MISEKYADMTTKGSIIREFAQYASKRAAEIGKENVYNFTIGNPLFRYVRSLQRHWNGC